MIAADLALSRNLDKNQIDSKALHHRRPCLARPPHSRSMNRVNA